MNLKFRSEEKEIMDLPNLPFADIRLAIKEIEKINQLLGGFNQTLADIQKFEPKDSRLCIQDWGCGSGDLLRKVYLWSRRNNLSLDLSGWDIDRETIAYATEKTPYPISFFCSDIMSPALKNQSTDIVCSCLFTHHFNNKEWIELIQKMYSVSRKGIIVNDLHRHWFAYYSIRFLTRWWAKSYMVRNDAPLSVAKGFTKKELVQLLNQVGIKNYILKWKWAFRWSLVIFKESN